MVTTCSGITLKSSCSNLACLMLNTTVFMALLERGTGLCIPLTVPVVWRMIGSAFLEFDMGYASYFSRRSSIKMMSESSPHRVLFSFLTISNAGMAYSPPIGLGNRMMFSMPSLSLSSRRRFITLGNAKTSEIIRSVIFSLSIILYICFSSYRSRW